jgi:Tol biopolymer transport system component
MLKLLITCLILINLTVLLTASSIYDDLQYYQTDKELWNVTSSEFRNDIKSDSQLDLINSKLIVFFRFTVTVDPDYIALSINNVPFDNLSDHIHPLGSGYIVDIADKVMMGRNSIDIAYDEPGQRSNRNWSFYVTRLNFFNLEDPIPVTQVRGDKKNMVVSPDGRLVAYILEDMNKTSIMLLNLETREELDVITSQTDRARRPDHEDKFYSYAPCWSRDGHYLFFISTKDGNPQIYRIAVDYHGNVDRKSMLQLTDSKDYVTNLVYSPFEERLYFSRITDGWLRLYQVDEAIYTSSSDEFSKAKRLVTNDSRHEYTPDISFNGDYLAFCHEARDSDSKIEIIDRATHNIVDTIAIPGGDTLYPSWSPKTNLLAFFSGNSIYVYNVDKRGNPMRIASDRRLSTYIQKPVWDIDGNHIHFIKNDNNYSINRCKLDFSKLQNSRSYAYVDSQSNRDNREIAITPDLKNILYISTQGGVFNIWTMQRKGARGESIAHFDTHANSTLSWINPIDREQKLLGYSPLIKHAQATYEIERVGVGPQSFIINGDKQVLTTDPYSPSLLEYKGLDLEQPGYSKSVYYSIFPGWGQRKNHEYGKSKFFFRSLLGLAAVGAGTYLLEENAYDKYDNAKTMKDIDQYRTETVTYESYRKGIITTASLLYLMSIVDAAFSQPKISPDRYEAYQNAYSQRKTMNQRYRQIYGKELNGLAELKIITNQPETDVYLEDRYGTETYYGRINYDFDNNVHFTITNLEPGSYTILGKNNRYRPTTTSVELEPYLVQYSTLEFQKSSTNFFVRTLNVTVPSYYQFNNKQELKGGAILGLTAVAMIGALICNQNANNEYENYDSFNNYNNLAQLRDHKDSYIRNLSYRNTFLGLLGMTYLYNLYDVLGG